MKRTKSTERAARISDLELRHQDNVHQIDLTGRDEEARLLKLRLLTLRDENSSLKDRLVQRDALVKQITKKGKDAHAELAEAKEKLKAQEMQLRKQGNELEGLKVGQDSNKVLQEKLALSHKLDQIQPELEHLKTQLENHRAVVAQKQDLERQLSSIEVELENEKRSKKRMQSKNHDNDQVKEQLDEAKRELEKLKKEHTRELREVRGECDMLEGRVEDTRSKLKKTQGDLKDTRAELASCRAELEEARKALATNKSSKKSVTMKEHPIGKKRAQDLSMEDISIGTPGPDEATLRRPSKKRGAERALVGEKSTFSITPFLNRTKNLSDNMSDELSELHSPTGKSTGASEPVVFEDVAPEAGDSMSMEPVEEAAEPDHQAEDDAVAEEEEQPKAQKARGRPRKALDDAPTTKKNMPVQAKRKAKAAKASSRVEMIAEVDEADEPETEPIEKPKKVPGLLKSNPATASLRIGNDDADTRKKKRKMLGGGNKTLFDDEEAEPAPRPAKIQMGAGRRLKAPLGNVRGAFGGATFSPLKKDRRGVSRVSHTLIATKSFITKNVYFNSSNLMNIRLPSTFPSLGWKLSPCLLHSRPVAESIRWSSSGSRWKQRQGRDAYARGAKVQGLKSRAAFKLLEMDSKYKLFKGNGQTVVDLGYAPGSWSQVAVERTRPNGRVIGIDLIPAQPPRGVATFQGDFLSPVVQEMVKNFILESHQNPPVGQEIEKTGSGTKEGITVDRPSYLDMERHTGQNEPPASGPEGSSKRIVDVVLSDMSAPWEQTTGFSVKTLSNPYHRLMNTSGNGFRDHVGSMDLCAAALQFASDTLRSGGHFVCKFYQGPEDKEFEKKLKTLFTKVFREKPDSSRKVLPEVKS
ncbi:FtsJ-like methyltransferase-domain-containing protein [Fusarium oxysporum Fo47]|nr:FtsJ-like methyltransferase-domain-containing protein [Fusarium oxysporum Fo47]WJG35355.1 FtsJ-like methyltransferase-domain-containing protein [Fusarium oxysporum Fo47]